jgi:surfeit locus 1 family protein
VITRLRAAGLLWPSLMTAAMLPILLGLGTWQLQRKAWKEGLIYARDMRAGPTGGIYEYGDEVLRPGQVSEYVKITIEGHYRHEFERYWFADGPEGTGFHVFTPFERKRGGIVWIDRGYVPARLRAPETRRIGQIEGNTFVSGIARFTGERNAFTPANDIAKNIWYWKDLPALQASAFQPSVPYAPFMIALDGLAIPGREPPGGWPRPTYGLPRLSNRHLEYAFTWYALAATLIGVFCVFAYGRLASAQK